MLLTIGSLSLRKGDPDFRSAKRSHAVAGSAALYQPSCRQSSLASTVGVGLRLSRAQAAARIDSSCTSSVITSKRQSELAPNAIVIGTSPASRPRAITMRPMRRSL